jgi:hypothetical protein
LFKQQNVMSTHFICSTSLKRTLHFMYVCIKPLPVKVAELSKACTVFARSEAGIVGSNPTQGMEVWCLFVYVYR